MTYLNEDEKELAYKYITLPLAKTVLERDAGLIESNPSLKMSSLYSELLHDTSIQISKEMQLIKKKMSKIGLSVYNDDFNTDHFKVGYTAFTRGYESKFGYTRIVLKTNVEKELRRILGMKKWGG